VPTGDSNTLDASSRVTRPCIEIAAHTPLYEETLSQAYHNPATSKHESTSINVCVHHHLWDKGKTEAVRGHWGSRTRERASVTSIYGSGRRVPLCQGAVEMPACQHDRSAAALSCSLRLQRSWLVGVLRGVCAEVVRERQGGFEPGTRAAGSADVTSRVMDLERGRSSRADPPHTLFSREICARLHPASCEDLFLCPDTARAGFSAQIL